MQSVTNQTFYTQHLTVTAVADDDSADFEVVFQVRKIGDDSVLETVTMVCNKVEFFQFVDMRPTSEPGTFCLNPIEGGTLSVILIDGILQVYGLDAEDMRDVAW